ncbi:hypothetical protein [Marinilabilia rubra]|uniref:DUF5017 domain-containing protein n=1 Tax=Marinilabilia rubra TaxID=2162893 RepID=A0A2U2B8X3_9BACT|nr:hypothetical protein [Marinilabilia rubra]PWD99493.1 hypothetical protein DDZ16_10845 [Marinilabilia rubra]
MMTIVSCSKDIESPEVSFTADKVNVQVGETVTFTVTGDAQTYAIFTGDSLHNFESSHLAITAGLDLDQEEVMLTADSITSLTPWLTGIVDDYNADLAEGVTPVNTQTILEDLGTVVGKKYTNKETAAYEAFLMLIELNNGDDNSLAQNVARDMVDLFYEDHSVVLAPEEGFSTGFAINRYDKTFEYAYSEPGTYTATLIATDVSDKIYSGSGYQDDRSSSGDEYDLERTIKELTITVQPAE